MASELRRKGERVRAQVPVRLKDQAGEGVTENLSATGVFMVTDVALREGQEVRFSIEFNSVDPAGVLYLECVGEVARLEEIAGRRGVGIKITEFRLERRDRRVQAIDAETARRKGSAKERRRPWARSSAIAPAED